MLDIGLCTLVPITAQVRYTLQFTRKLPTVDCDILLGGALIKGRAKDQDKNIANSVMTAAKQVIRAPNLTPHKATQRCFARIGNSGAT